MKVHTVVAALDGSPRTSAVLEAAATSAHTLGATKLVLVRAVAEPSEIPQEVLARRMPEIGDLLVKVAREDLDVTARAVPADLLTSVQVRVGPAWRIILEVAREVDAGLVVLGAHGYSAMERMLGTTAARVVNHADRSVLVVREPKRRPS